MADGLNGRGLGPAIRATLALGAIPEVAAVTVSVDGGRKTVDGQPASATLDLSGGSRARLLTDGAIDEVGHRLLFVPLPDLRRAARGVTRVEVVVDGWRFEVDLEDEAHARLRERATGGNGGSAKGGPLELRAIIPGRVVSVDVAEGDTVEAGGRLLVVEAMKMQNEIRTPRGGRIGRVAVGPGERVELGDLLLVVE